MSEVTYSILIRRPVHLLRNATNPQELRFILEKLKAQILKGRRSFSFQFLTIYILYQEFKHQKFQKYHRQTWITYKNKNKALAQLLTNPKRLNKNTVKKALESFHTEKKTFRQIWVELLRDCIDFWSYTGVLPNYHKGSRLGSNHSYLVSDLALKYVTLNTKENKQIFFAKALINFKIRNSCIDYATYISLNRKLRPFYVSLKILLLLSDKGINYIPQRTLAQATATIYNESEIPQVVDELALLYTQDPDHNLNLNYLELTHLISDKIIKEASRASSVLIPNLVYAGLIRENKINGKIVFAITKKGRHLISITPQNAIYFAETLTESSPIIAATLKLFASLSKKGINQVGKRKIIEKFNTNPLIMNKILSTIQKEFKPSPIDDMKDDKIVLGTFEQQYHVTPFSDFASLREARIANGHTTASSIIEFALTKKIPDNLLNNLKNAGLSSEGQKFEEAIYEILKKFPKNNCYWYGTQATGKRLPDFVWLNTIQDPAYIDKPRPLIIIVEAKAGDAVRAFDHNIVREEISNSLKKLQKEIYHNSIGIWYWLISGKDLPRSSSEEHGGPRGDNLSHTLPQKLFEIVRTAPKSPVYATCFTTSTWACYISYLYGLIATYNINVITPTSVPHFWNWSPNHLFTNDVGAPVSVYNNSLPFCNNFE